MCAHGGILGAIAVASAATFALVDRTSGTGSDASGFEVSACNESTTVECGDAVWWRQGS